MKKTNKIISILLVLAMLLSMAPITVFAADTPAFSGGTGTQADPYLLATADDLVTLKDFVISGGADALDNADDCGLGAFHGYYFKLIKDIDMSGVEEWTPFNFNGTFDGAGHTISNMQMNENFFESADPANNEYKSAEYEAAFFGQVVHATIKNLYFDNCSVEISDGLDPSSSRDIYVGIVATTAIASCFENVSATNCTVAQNGEDDNFAYSGGLVGYADICHFEYCSFDGTITTGGDATGSQCAGGLIGGWGDMYYEFIADYGNPYNMVVGAGKDFGIYNSFSTAEINNPYFYSSAGIVGFLCTDFIPAEIENCAFGGKITAGGRAAGIMGEGEKDDYYIDCVVYAEEITTSNVAYALGMNATEVTNCKLSDKTVISGTKETQLNGLTPVTLATDEEKIENFKSNLHGKLADGMANVKITLSQNDEVKYTAVTDADGEFNFGKQVIRGDYTLNIAASDAAEAYETEVTIEYATNHELDITRVIKHTHSFTYTASGGTITAICANTDGACPDTNGGSFTLQAPSSLIADGKAKQFTYTGSISGVTPKITYSQEPIPANAGTYTVTMSITVEGTTYSVSREYTIVDGLYVTFKSNSITTTETANWTPDPKAFDTSTGIHFRTSGNNKDSVVGANYTVQWYDAENKPLSDAPTDAGTYTIKVKLNDSLSGTCILQTDTLTYTINPLDLSTGMVGFRGWPNGQPRYNGQQQLPDATIGNSSYILPESSYIIEAIEGKNCTNAGTAYCLLKGTGGNVIGEKELSYYINMAQIDLPEAAKRTYTYDGTPKATDFSGETLPTGYASIEALYWYKAGSNTRLSEAPSNVGEYEVYVKYTPTDAVNYQTKYRKEAFEIKAATPVVTTPTAVSGLVYNGEAQALITAGSVNGGEMQYSTDGVEYSATIPTATNAGDYTVYYKVVGDENHNDTEPATVTVTIKTKDISDAFIILGDALTYNGAEQTQTVTTVEIPADLDVTYTVSGNKATNVGVYLLTVTGNGNFSGEAKIDYEIAPDTTSIDALTAENVTSADKAAVEAVKAQIDNAVTDLADDEKKAEYKAIADKCDELLKKIDETATEIERIEEAVNGYDEATVKSTDKADLEQLIEDIKALTDATNITAEERAALEALDAKLDSLIKKIDDTAAEIARIDEAVNAYDEETVKSSDVQALGKLIEDIKALTDGVNLTEDEKAALEADDATVDALIEKLTKVAEEIKRVDEAVKSYDEETIKSSDSDELTQLKEDVQALIDSTNTTENEKTVLGEMIADIEALEDKIEETAKEIERIENAVAGYDEETVKSSDIQALGKLIEDIKALTDGDNITEDEKAALEADDAAVDALVEKLAEVAEEIKRVDDAVKSYDENTVKSTDKENLTQLKDDVQALIDSTNTTENEKTALGEMIKDIEALEDKIEETEAQLEEIKGIENNYNPENITSDDKAAIEAAIAEIEAVNPDNLTDEQKAEYEEIKAEFEVLLAEIEAADKAVSDIGVELEMFDENRVTIFWEDDIEALKAKIDELLVNENMGTAEKAKLNEYKAQADKLIEIINTPKEYISCRFFYFIWDCLTWKWNGILWIFSNLFGC